MCKFLWHNIELEFTLFETCMCMRHSLELEISQVLFIFQLFSVKAKSNTPKESLRIQLAEQILSASTSDLKKPQFVFRPPPLQPNVDEIVRRSKTEAGFSDAVLSCARLGTRSPR